MFHLTNQICWSITYYSIRYSSSFYGWLKIYQNRTISVQLAHIIHYLCNITIFTQSILYYCFCIKFDVQVTDKGTPALSSDKTTIVIEIIDVDDHLPSFQEESKQLYVRENRTAGELVENVTAVDEDLDSIACYSIVGRKC